MTITVFCIICLLKGNSPNIHYMGMERIKRECIIVKGKVT